MTTLGWLHVGAAAVALVAGASVFAFQKGTRRHVLVGRVFGVGMLLVNLPALLLYEASGTLGPFHLLALISLATLTAGLAPLLLGHRGRGHVARHGVFMSWSYVGLVAAGLAQLGNGLYGGGAVLVVTSIVVAIGGVTIHLAGPRIARASGGTPGPAPTPARRDR